MTTIHEGLEQSRAQVQAEAEIAKGYPDARTEVLPGRLQVWSSPKVLDAAEGVRILADTPIMCAIYTLVEGTPVFHPSYMQIQKALELVQAKDPEAYRRVVKVLADEFRTQG